MYTVVSKFFTTNSRQGANRVLYNERLTRYHKLDKNSSIRKLAGWTLTRYQHAYKVLVVELRVDHFPTLGYNNINYKRYRVYCCF